MSTLFFVVAPKRCLLYERIVAATKPIPVRLSDDIQDRLRAAAEKMGSNSAAIIRLCVTSFLSDFEQRGAASLPLDWQSVIAANDGRTRLAKEQEPASTTRTRQGTPWSDRPSSSAEDAAREAAKRAAASVVRRRRGSRH